MIRFLIDLLLPIFLILVARAVLKSVFKGVANASANASRNPAGFNSAQNPTAGPGKPGPAPPQSSAGELHRDPVCGTYVSSSTGYFRKTGSQTFYYCSQDCREKHSLVAR